MPRKLHNAPCSGVLLQGVGHQRYGSLELCIFLGVRALIVFLYYRRNEVLHEFRRRCWMTSNWTSRLPTRGVSCWIISLPPKTLTKSLLSAKLPLVRTSRRTLVEGLFRGSSWTRPTESHAGACCNTFRRMPRSSQSCQRTRWLEFLFKHPRSKNKKIPYMQIILFSFLQYCYGLQNPLNSL